jgi:hypothetical protein
LIFTAPSRSEYCEWTWRWLNCAIEFPDAADRKDRKRGRPRKQGEQEERR